MKTEINIVKFIVMPAILCMLITNCSVDSAIEADSIVTEDALLSKQSNAKMDSKKKYNFSVHLSGDNEVPSRETNATGQAIVKISSDDSMIHFKLIVANIENVRASHFHLAPEGVNGPVVIGLFTGPKKEGRFNGILSEGYITAESFAENGEASLSNLIENIRNGNIYVNVHTDRYPPGELRGQL